MTNSITLTNEQSVFPQIMNSVTQNNNLYNSMLLHYTNKDFLVGVIRICLYQSDFGLVLASRSNEVIDFIKKFTNDITKDVKSTSSFPISVSKFLSQLSTIKKILEIRGDVSSRLLTYDNVSQHFQGVDMATSNLLNDASQNRIETLPQFKRELEDLLQNIEIYNQFRTIGIQIKTSDFLQTEFNQNSSSPLSFLQHWNHFVTEAHASLSDLTILQNKKDKSDAIEFYDKPSIDQAVKKLSTFLGESYNKYQTGYDVIDKNIGGIESSSVSLITGPSNHAKSLFMINLARSMIENNSFDNEKVESNAFLFVTLEDDSTRLVKRVVPIFGNQEAEIIQHVFTKSSEIFKSQKSKDIIDKNLINQTENFLKDLLIESITTVTYPNCKFIIKHSEENTYSVRDIEKLIDKYKLEGTEIKAVFIDYLDCMVPSAMLHTNFNDYDAHGVIVQEMRAAARRLAIPFITITQNTRSAENLQQEMNNSLIGDSYKKVRFSDYIFMVRLRSDLDILSDAVKKDVVGDDSFDISNVGQINAIPFVKEAA